MFWRILYRIDDSQIMAYVANDTIRPSEEELPDYDSDELASVEIANPSFPISRDHKVVLEDGEVVDTEYSENPVQPAPPDPTRKIHYAQVSKLNPDATKPLEVTREWMGEKVSVDCYVTQDLVDAYQADNLVVGDYVLVVFVDNDTDKPCATQKVYKSW